jgi:protease I
MYRKRYKSNLNEGAHMMESDETPLSGMRIAILATDMVEEAELVEPRAALEEAGAEVDLIAPKGDEIISANHHNKSEPYPVDHVLSEVDAADYDGVLLPGGALNADVMRVEPRVKEFLRDMNDAAKPMAIICHAPWELISAGLVEGRHLTSYHTIADDIRNAGGEWSDEEVVIDNNWVSSRQPDDIPAFNAAMIDLFAQIYHGDGLPV